ncbi:MAG: general secretion pathway protein GspB [Rhodoferax sp.]
MSYILDALQRADAERERGSVPGLHARPVSPGTSGAPPRSAASQVWLLAALAAALLVGAALWWWRSAPSPANPASTPSAAAPAAPAPAAPVAGLPTAPPAPLAAADTVVAHSTAPSVPALPAAAPSAPPAAVSMAAPAKAVPAVAAAPKVSAGDKADAAKDATVPLLSELSDELRRQVPPLAISGAVYSQNPAQRLLLVNAQVLNQGSSAAPDLTLEEIQPHAAVFNFRGARFRLAY